MRRMPCARGTKAKYRIDAFYDLKDKDVQVMIECNTGKITREEALEKMINKKEFIK